MDLRELDPEQDLGDILLEEELLSASPVQTPPRERRSRKQPRKKNRRRLWILLPVALAVALGGYVWLRWTDITLLADPAGALTRGAEMVRSISNPARLGALGQLSLEGVDYDYSGTLALEAGEEGLKLALEDFTLASQEGSHTFSLYLSPQEAALSAPDLTEGSTQWYGVALDRPMEEQAAGTGGDPDYGWYFSAEQMDAFQTAADTVREAMGSATQWGFSQEQKETLAAFFQSCQGKAGKSDTGYTLAFEAEDQAIRDLCGDLDLPGDLFYGDTQLTFGLTPQGALAKIWVTSQGAELLLELGEDPTRELSPRLEGSWPGENGQINSIALALTVDQGTPLTAPSYQNAFALLPYVEGAVRETSAPEETAG